MKRVISIVTIGGYIAIGALLGLFGSKLIQDLHSCFKQQKTFIECMNEDDNQDDASWVINL